MAGKSNSRRTRAATSTLFGMWCAFCRELGHAPTLGTVPDPKDRLCCLLVFAIRYRRGGQGNQPVRADTVGKALLAVGMGITDLGLPDPRKRTPGDAQNHPLLAAFLQRLRDEDSPSTRSYPANITILRALSSLPTLSHPVFGP